MTRRTSEGSRSCAAAQATGTTTRAGSCRCRWLWRWPPSAVRCSCARVRRSSRHGHGHQSTCPRPPAPFRDGPAWPAPPPRLARTRCDRRPCTRRRPTPWSADRAPARLPGWPVALPACCHGPARCPQAFPLAARPR
uniref:Uncharacterized protein n=1 Tax=uncultured marine virus TaxID=186617 RepID=A0A0F7L5G4_9VIRU|nr:hypothetical protein [uncultured marine virus]